MILHALNLVIEDPKQKFDFYDSSDVIETFFIHQLWASPLYIKNSPFAAAPQIAKNPLVTKTWVLMPQLVREASLLVGLQKDLQRLGDLCDPGAHLGEMATHLEAQADLIESRAFLKFLKEMNQRCRSDEADRLYQNSLVAIYMSSASLSAKIRIQKDLR